MERDPIIVAGAGPGGLTAALALARVGLPVRLLERAPEIRAAGAGLTLQVNAMRMLDALDLLEPVQAAGEVLRCARVETEAGRTLSTLPLEEAHERHGAPGIAIHRGVLARVLAAALPRDVLRCGAGVITWQEAPGGVVVTLEDGTSLRGRALIGADGIHSRIRAAMLDDPPLRYAGYTCWRGIAPVARPLGDGVASERWGRGRRFGIVPIGPTETYWFATENAPADRPDGDDVQAELLERFADFAEPVPTLLRATPRDAILHNDIVDLPPIPRWTTGSVALLGDAAHAMTPNMGQGACQAIEDAVVLADCLAHAEAIGPALARYEARRRERALGFQRRSWSLGRAAQWENAVARVLRNGVTRLTPQAMVRSAVANTWDVDVPALDRVG